MKIRGLSEIFFVCLLLARSVFAHNALEVIEPRVKDNGGDQENLCVVFVSDRNYFGKFLTTLSQLRNEGNYSGDVVLIATGDLHPRFVKRKCQDKKLTIAKFAPIFVPEGVKKVALKPPCVEAQMQKFHVFQTFFKQWNYVFYIDVGMQIHGDIEKITNLCEKETLLAHSNCYPTYVWNHGIEFIDDHSSSYQQLIADFDLTNDSFQTTMLLFDTNLIDDNTVNNLMKLLDKYPFGSSDQSYITLYFCHILPVWKQIKINEGDLFLYDFHPRVKNKYIMHKYNGGPEKCLDCK